MNHVWLSTHISGHTLDLIITNDEIAVQSTQTRNYISDYCFVKVVTTMDKPEVPTKEIRYRKLGEINLDNLKSDMASSDLIRADYNETSLTELANLYDSNLKEILEHTM